MSHLQNLGNRFNIVIPSDEHGYVGRECPVEECLGYFKITLGTGLKEPAPCHCPYCGHSGDPGTFSTKDQIEYATSLVLQKVTGAIQKDLKSLEFEHKPRGVFGIGISLKVNTSTPRPIRYYREKRLETEVICNSCTLRYAIYGVFGWCPDCGVHNSLQILTKNLELSRKQVILAESAEKDLANHLIGDALENVVSAFDGFGREICRRKGADIHFQNLVAARRKVQDMFAFDFASPLSQKDWGHVCRAFLKRHLLAHKMGVVDEEYVQRANDPQAVVGRKVPIGSQDVNSSIRIVQTLGERLFEGLLHPKP